EAADADGLGSPAAHGGGEQVQGGHANGQSGLLERRDAASGGDDLGGRDRECDGSSCLDRPSDLAARPDRNYRAGRGSGDARLGPLAGRGGEASVYFGWTGIPDEV